MDLFSPDFPFENMLKGKWWNAKVVIYTFCISNYIFDINSIRKKNTFRFALMSLILMAYEITLKNQCVEVRW